MPVGAALTTSAGDMRGSEERSMPVGASIPPVCRPRLSMNIALVAWNPSRSEVT